MDDRAFDGWSVLEEIVHLLLSGKAHHAFYACAVVPTAVEDHHLSCRG